MAEKKDAKKVFIMNKNVEHNGIKYDKGAEIKESDEGFEEIVKAGHASDVLAKEEIAHEGPKEVNPQGEQAEQSVESSKSAGKSKK